MTKKIMTIILAVVSMGIFAWRGYQYYDVPEYMLKRIKAWEEYKETITLYSNGNDITEQFFEDNKLNYKLHNWNSILKYIREDLEGGIVVSGKYKID